MNKALMVSIRSKWLEMILNGKKTFEFRNWKVDKGTVIYFYCTKAKPILYDGYKEYIGHNDFKEDSCPLNGKVVAKAVVKEVYDLTNNEDSFNWITNNGKYTIEKDMIGVDDAVKMGYTDQRYALELTDIEAIEPRELTSFIGYKKANRVKHIAESFEELIKREDKLSTNIRITHAPQSRVWVLEEEV